VSTLVGRFGRATQRLCVQKTAAAAAVKFKATDVSLPLPARRRRPRRPLTHSPITVIYIHTLARLNHVRSVSSRPDPGIARGSEGDSLDDGMTGVFRERSLDRSTSLSLVVVARENSIRSYVNTVRRNAWICTRCLLDRGKAMLEIVSKSQK